MPYWNRNDELNRTLESYSVYDFPMEVIIVDDGSPKPAKPIWTKFRQTVVRLPDKTLPKNPCIPINIGIEAAEGDYLCITNPEVFHVEPVFQEMMTDHYVLAACWDAGRKKWVCRSDTKHFEPVPEGFGLHFCGVLPMDQVVKFDERYREGRGYDDNDWAFSLHSKGVQCEIRDDLVVYHQETPRVAWRMPSNRNRFYRKWNLS